jgi:tRNA pseudouridine32 synthase / 23S rRNA pseudouridine746 synthase
MSLTPKELWYFESNEVANLQLPDRFTFPFYYTPHPLAILAAERLQEFLAHNAQFDHNFGLNPEQEGLIIGKMFGVLVVQDHEGRLGYLQAFSGKLAGVNHHEGFVPPVFDMLTDDGFFRQEEEVLNALNRKIEALESSDELAQAKSNLEQVKVLSAIELQDIKQQIKTGKVRRKAIRETLNELEESITESLRQESVKEQYYLKDRTRYWKEQITQTQYELDELLNGLQVWKEERKQRSAALQNKLFDAYTFRNAIGEEQSLLRIFSRTTQLVPPAGAGECAAPKLLQFAYIHGLKPIALAEFWWGASPKSEVRLHAQYYPACRGKCEPILGHMLGGLSVDPNPMLEEISAPKELTTIFEDDYMWVIDKPAELLSVPGKTKAISVYDIARERFPEATGPLLVHRLDMSTSGILVIAKSMEAYTFLQRQFVQRRTEKIYEALLEGELLQDSGLVDLPLRVDLNDRPRQLVCYTYGKEAQTKWHVLERMDGQTRVEFIPITGRTHQLRVHAAHSLGLQAPIVGDDLYGTKGSRLYLHARLLRIAHPITKQAMEFEAKVPF